MAIFIEITERWLANWYNAFQMWIIRIYYLNSIPHSEHTHCGCRLTVYIHNVFVFIFTYSYGLLKLFISFSLEVTILI